MNRKYELIADDTSELDGRTLYRIRALRDFADVRAGELGGYVESERNLSHDGDAQVFGRSQVFGDARVFGRSQVFGDAWVSGDARVFDGARIESQTDWLSIGPIGSRGDAVTFFRAPDGGANVCCGCFSGTLDEFAAAVEKTHGDSAHGKAYRLATELAKLRLGL